MPRHLRSSKYPHFTGGLRVGNARWQSAAHVGKCQPSDALSAGRDATGGAQRASLAGATKVHRIKGLFTAHILRSTLKYLLPVHDPASDGSLNQPSSAPLSSVAPAFPSPFPYALHTRFTQANKALPRDHVGDPVPAFERSTPFSISRSR